MDLYKNYEHMEYDGLITDVLPEVIVSGGKIRKGSDEVTLKRGTILAKSSGTAGDGKLVIDNGWTAENDSYKVTTAAASNETLTAYAILCDDTVVGTEADVTTAIYIGGCFDLAKCTVAASHTVSEAEKDALRNGGIIFKAPQTM